MSITQKQDLPENIELLAAQRSLYSRAKNIIGLQMIFSVPVAITAAVVTIMKPDLGGYIAIWCLLVVSLDLLTFTPLTKRLLENAAKVQELFDTRVLGLEWNKISAGRKPEAELIHEEAGRYGMDADDIAVLTGWYPKILDTLPHIIGVIISQRSNIWWDSRIRRKYVFFIKVALALIAIALIGYGLYQEKDMFEFLVYLIVPLSSTYIFGYRQIEAHSASANRLDALKECSKNIWLDALSGKDTEHLKLECEKLQTQIFDHRKQNPPIFDFIFRYLRGRDELLMNQGAKTLVKEFAESAES